MKCISDLTHEDLKELVYSLIRDGAEVQGESEEDFLLSNYNLRYYKDSKEFTSYAVDDLIRKLVEEHLPHMEECDAGGSGPDEYMICFIDWATDDSFEITYSMTEDIAILSDIVGDEPRISAIDKILEEIVIPKINAIFQ